MKAYWNMINVAGAALFGVFAWLQHNDIDPERYDHPSSVDALLWVAFYALVAALFLAALAGKFPRILLGIAALWCLVEMARTAPGLYDNLFRQEKFVLTGSQMSAQRPYVELSREFFGALIALAGVGLLWWQRRRQVATERRETSGASVQP